MAELSDIAFYVTDKISSESIAIEEYVTTDNILQNKVGRTIATNLPPNPCSLTLFHKGDVLVANIRPYLKKIWKADKIGGASNDVLVFRAKSGHNPDFLYSVLLQDSFFDHCMKGAEGAKMPRGNKTNILRFPVSSLTLDQECSIGSFISNIDKKIELNRQTNCDLEAMAKQLYDYWFVQFDFPNENGKPYKSSGGKMVWDSDLQKMIPEEWICISLSEILSNNKIRQVNPATQPNTLFKHLSFPSFDKCGSYEEEYGAEIHSNKIVVEESYVLAAKLNPWIKRVAWGTHEENLICSTEFVVLNPKDIKYKTYIYVMANQTSFIDYCSTSTTGTSHSQRRIKPESMKMFKFAFNEDICKKFCDAVEPMIKKQLENLRLIQSLQKQRDYLLPLLMNGQVTIK